jgi:hypothetical protein
MCRGFIRQAVPAVNIDINASRRRSLGNAVSSSEIDMAITLEGAFEFN